jgi:hypothetical protein
MLVSEHAQDWKSSALREVYLDRMPLRPPTDLSTACEVWRLSRIGVSPQRERHVPLAALGQLLLENISSCAVAIIRTIRLIFLDSDDRRHDGLAVD